MTRPPRRGIADLDEVGYVHDPPPPYATEDQSARKLFNTGPNELKVWPQNPSNTRISLSGSKQRGRGRPRKDLDLSTKRTIIRLFVGTSTSIERIIRAITKQDGPKRQWVINFLNMLTDTGPDADMSLSQLRLEDESQKGEMTGAYRRGEKVSVPEEWDCCELAGQQHVHTASKGLLDLEDVPEQVLASREVNSSRNPTSEPPISPMTQEAIFNSEPPRQLQGKRKMARPSPTGIVDELDGRKGGPSYHVGRCCSVTKPTIASRMSSIYSVCNLQAERTEFVKHYANLGTIEQTLDNNEPGEYAAKSVPEPSDSRSSVTPLVLNLILRAPTDDQKDEHLVDRLAEMFLGENEVSIISLVNHADHRKVTPLHAAAALGLRKTCRELMAHGARTDARTSEGTCINHFAKQAERIAGKTDPKLYFRIMHCRKYVKRGIPPPVPNRKARNKRRMSEQASPNPSSAGTKGRKIHRKTPPRASATTPSPGPSTNSLYFAGPNNNIGGAQIQPLLERGITESPAASVHANSSTTDFQDFACFNNMRRRAAIRSMRTQASPPERNLVNASSAVASFGITSTTNVDERGHTADYEYGIQDLFDSGTDYHYLAAAPVQHEGIFRSAEAMRSFDFGDESIQPAPATSVDPSLMWQPSIDFRDAGEQNAYHAPVFQPDQHQHPSQQPLQHAISFQSDMVPSQELSPSTFSPIEHGVPNISTDIEVGTVYWHCPHGMPRNLEISHCLQGCPRLG